MLIIIVIPGVNFMNKKLRVGCVCEVKKTKESIHIHVHIFNPKGGMLVFGKSCASCFIFSVKYAMILSTATKRFQKTQSL